MAKKRLSGIELDEVSLVDRGANPGAHIAFWKRDGRVAALTKRLGDLFSTAFPAEDVATAAIAKAMSNPSMAAPADPALEGGDGMEAPEMFAEALAEAEILPSIWRANDALCTSIRSIMDDAAPADREPLLRATLGQFTQHLLEVVAGSVTKMAPKACQGDEMSDAIKKALGLEAAATEAQVAEAVTKLLADTKTATEGLAKAQADAAFAALPDAHRAFAVSKGYEGQARADFVAKSEADREALIKAEPKTAAEIELAKRDTEVAELRKRLDAQDDANAIAAFTKRAETDLTNIGKAAEVGGLLHTIAKADKGAAEKVEALLKAADEAIAKGGLFNEFGNPRRGIAKGAAGIEAAAAELRKSNPTWSIQKARTEARKANPDLAAQEREENRQAA